MEKQAAFHPRDQLCHDHSAGPLLFFINIVSIEVYFDSISLNKRVNMKNGREDRGKCDEWLQKIAFLFNALLIPPGALVETGDAGPNSRLLNRAVKTERWGTG